MMISISKAIIVWFFGAVGFKSYSIDVIGEAS